MSLLCKVAAAVTVLNLLCFLLKISMELLRFLFYTFMLMFTSGYIQPATSRHQHDNFTDLNSLLAFKSEVSDPAGILDANWTTNTSFCNWYGISCSLRQRQRATAIQLPNLSLQGTISPHLGNLSFLSTLVLTNNSLTGPIPEILGQLPRLTQLYLTNNFLTGPFPPTILNMSSLTKLYVEKNNLSGSLSSNNSFDMLPNIQELSLSANNFVGEVLLSLTRCKYIQILGISLNQFTGLIPAEIGSLSKLTGLYLDQNQLTGMIPTSLGNLTKLSELHLALNNLTGVIPIELGNLLNLQVLRLDENNLHSSIPASLLNASFLYYLDLAHNNLTGPVPSGIGKSLPLLKRFNVADNQLTGGLEFLSSLSNCRNLIHLGIDVNNLEGILPDSIGNLSNTLQRFYAYETYIKGKLPDGLGNLTGLYVLSLFETELEGPIPSTLAKLKMLQLMDLRYSRISGPIPNEIGLMSRLSFLYLDNNSISGPIPDSLANASMLAQLFLRNNKFSSVIPQSLYTLETLQYLDLSRNSLHGTLPPQVGNLKSLIYFDLSMNQLSGNITDAFEELQMLEYLDLSKNSFQGQIPASFGRLISATYLNFSHNFLSGSIPNSLANLHYLNSLDLSFNELEGQVPSSGVFLNVSITKLMGKEELCGAAWLGFPACSGTLVSNHSKRKLQVLKYILPIIASVILLSCFSLIYISCYKKKVVTTVHTDKTSSPDHRLISYQEIVRATNNFSEANLLGKGGFGAVFKGCLDDGSIVAVKVLNLEVDGASESFDGECHVLSQLRHRNLIKIICVCSNMEFKALVLQFMPNGSLEKWLHSDYCYLNLLRRLNIMLEVSFALEYLHHYHPNIVLHCDLKPANVLLDEDMVAHVGDFGIAKLLLGDTVATTSMPGTIGYIAPEYASTGRASRMGDVYSFGILLLETFTGKRPSDDTFAEESSLREWVCRDYPTAVLEVVDYKLLKVHDTATEVHDTKNGSSKDLTTVQRCLASVIELGLLCSNYAPKERIPMTDVVVRLEKIKLEYISNS